MSESFDLTGEAERYLQLIRRSRWFIASLVGVAGVICLYVGLQMAFSNAWTTSGSTFLVFAVVIGALFHGLLGC